MPLSLPSRPADPALRRILVAGQAHPGHGLSLARAAWTQVQTQPDPVAKLQAGLALGLALNRAERPAEARAHLRDLAPRLAELGLLAELAICQWQSAAAQRILRDEAGILDRVSAAHTELTEQGLLLEANLCLRDLAIACLGVGDLDRAARCIDDGRTWLAARGLLADAATFAVTDCARLRRRGQFDAALEILEQAESVFAAEDLPGELAAVRLYQASIYSQRFETERAIPQLRRLLPIFESLDLPLRQAMTWNELGTNAECRADLAEAEAAYNASLRLSTQLQTCADQANTLYNLAVVRINQGELLAARRQFAEARAVFQQLGERPAMGLCLVGIGVTECSLGQYGLALRSLGAARQELRAVGVKEFEPNIDHNLGKTWLALGDPALAGEYFQKAVAGYQALEAHYGAARSLVHLALIEADSEHPEAALRLVDQARATAAATRAAGYLAVCDQISGEIRIRAGQNLQGLAALANAAAEFRRLGLPINAVAASISHADGLACLGRIEQAETGYTAALQQTTSALPDLAWRAAAGLARICEARQQPAEALAFHQQAMSALHTLRLRLGHELLVDAFLYRRQPAMENAIVSALNAGQPEVALGFVEEGRAQLLARKPPPASAAPDETGQQLRLEMTAIRRKLSGSLEAESSWLTLRPPTAQQAELLAQLDHAGRAYQAHTALAAQANAAPPDAGDFDLGRLRAALNAAQPRGWTCLAYYWLDHQLLLFAIDDQHITTTRTALNPLQALALDLCTAPEPDRRRAIYGDSQGLTESGPAAASRRYREILYRLLIPPAVQSQLRPDRLLLIVPAGKLHSLPFQALRQGDAYLCQQSILAVAPSLAAVHGRARPPEAASPALIVAIDDFGGEQPPLPFAQQEAQVVSGRLAGATVLSNLQATAGALRDQLSAHSQAPFAVLHFATHAVFDSDYGRLSRLLLSGGDLLADEIGDAHIPARLVVLAACQTALGHRHLGEEVVGLTQAFFSAGAQNVLSALWSVADADSPRFMDDFYAAYATQNQPPPAALADTQRRWIKAGRPASTWAAYSMFGTP